LNTRPNDLEQHLGEFCRGDALELDQWRGYTHITASDWK
jgi:hypothetical protein